MQKHDIGQLRKLYLDSEQCDHAVFAEMKSNLELVAGLHYTKKGSKFSERIRDAKGISENSKLRLTQNHIGKISKIYHNNITAHAPGVRVFPKNEDEPQDQKSAELRQSVWEDVKLKNRYREWVHKRARDFSDIGEVWTKIFFNPNKGRFLGYKQKLSLNPLTGQMEPQVDENGQPVAGEEAVFAGQIEWEDIYGFNLLRSPRAQTADASPYLCIRKMAPHDELKALAGNDEEKLKFITDSQDDTFKVFDGNTGQYTESKGQDMLLEFYFRPCKQYPNGYYYFATMRGILAEGEIPKGIFPIRGKNFDESQTSCRGRSWIKVARPYQIEINRCASAIATAQITWGDDKIVTAAGAKMSKGSDQPGVRHIQVSGPPPTVIPGRSGDQYVSWMEMNITNLYKSLDVNEDAMETSSGGQLDQYTLLYRSMRNKKKFNVYSETFEAFLTEVCETSLELANLYYDDAQLIPVIGKKEVVNIPEFRNTSPLSYQIKIEPQSEDLESNFGKQIALNHLLQYVGKDLAREDLGMVIRSMPLLNKEQLMGDLTIDADNATSDILSLDRGQYRPANRYDNHKYIIKRLIRRIKLRDFELLDPGIQALYHKKLEEHEKIEADLQQEILQQQAGYIPSGGYEVVCDLYAPDPQNPAKTRRLRIPSEALEWLVKRLEQQGTYTVGLTNMNQGAVADIAELMANKGAQPPSGTSKFAPQQGPGGLNGNGNTNNNGSSTSPNGSGGSGYNSSSAGRLPATGTGGSDTLQ